MRNKEFTKKVGKHVKVMRLEIGMSQEVFAEVCQLHRTYIGSVERGEKTITIESAKRLSEGLNMKLSDFFSRMGE